MKIWFTPDSLGLRLCDFINNATSSLDYCAYNSSRIDVTLALINAHNRGVRIRVITDNSRLDDPWVAYLRSAGITVWSDSISSGRSAYMHNKFALRDLADEDSTNDALWVASYNPNQNELCADCAFEIPGPALARAYLTEFNQMWGSAGNHPLPESARFHTSKQDLLPTHRFTIGGYPAYLYFAPQNRAVDTIAAFAARARSEILFAINSFTYDPLGDTLIQIWERGVTVAGTIDKAGALDPSSEYPRLRFWHIPILIDSVPYGSGILHEKIMLIDSTITVTGSANWSQNANLYNDENSLIILHPAVARRIRAEILTRYLEAGGTYPPGILEDRYIPSHPRGMTGTVPALPTTDALFDALGRKLTNPKAPPSGIYFCQGDGTAAAVRILLVK